MDILFPSTKLYISKSRIQGLGVFARADIRKNEVIEESPILLIPEDEISNLTKTKLFTYYFAWGNGFRQAAVVWGYGSLFNHSFKPNANYERDEKNELIRFIAIKDIKQDEEILVNYNGRPGDRTKLWFLEREKR